MTRQGQTTLEYLLLLSVVLSLVIMVIKSDAMKRLLGENSVLFSGIRYKIEHSYKHGYEGTERTIFADSKEYGNGTTHSSYEVPGGGSRFFFTLKYPQ